MSTLTKLKKDELSPGQIAVGQSYRASTLELTSSPPKKKDDEGELESSGDLRASFVFSSEYPVLRYDWWEDERYYEVLSHQKEHCDVSRIEQGVCPLLWNHNRDIQRGIIEGVSFSSEKASCDVLYDDDDEGRSLYKKVQQGTRKGVSFLYQVRGEYEEMPMDEAVTFIKKWGLDSRGYFPVRVSKNWEVFEVSHVSIPADPTVGVGKSFLLEDKESQPLIIQVKGYTNMKTGLQEVKELDSQTTIPSTQLVDQDQVKDEEGSKETQGLDLETVKSMILQAIQPVQQRNQELEQEKAQVATENLSLRQELEQERQEKLKAQQLADTFKDISQLIGRPEVQTPNVNLITNPSKTEPQGLAREFLDLFNSPKVKPNEVKHQGLVCVQRDHNVLAKFMHEHFAEERARGLRDWRRSPLIKELEQYFKNQGFLSGRAAGPTIGTPGSIGAIYLDVLSTLMRETHNPNNIWWQFATTIYDSTSAPNKSVLIPRHNYLPQPTDVSDFLIATPDTYNSINYVRGTGTDSQSLEITTVPLTIAQWGLGLSTNQGNRPVFIPEFHEATSLLNLMEILDRVLMQHYYSFEDLMIRKEFIKATTIYYNNNGAVTTVPGDVAAGDDGTLSKTFLNATYARLYADQLPTMTNNCYLLTVPPESLNNLKESLGTQYAPVTEEQNQAITNVLRAATGIEIGQSSGYVGQYCGFEIFSGNTWGVGNPGANNPTVNTTAFGAGATVTEDCFVFTFGAVGRGIALPMEIRASGTTPFNMGESFIWLSREQTGPVDLDATIAPTGQQTRAVKLRMSRRKV